MLLPRRYPATAMQIGSTTLASPPRPELLMLVTGYDETFSLIAAPDAISRSLPANRRIAFVVTRPFVKVLLVRHVNATLLALAVGSTLKQRLPWHRAWTTRPWLCSSGIDNRFRRRGGIAALRSSS